MEEDKPESWFNEAIEAEFKKGGIEALRDYVASNLDQWRSATVSIAVIGRTGVGKSTFINVFRNVKDDEPGAALTGVTETTTKIEGYQDPNNQNIQLFDLPGVGTERFPKNEYFKKIQMDRFDTFLLMTDTRFTENDAWLVEKLKAMGKPFFFVRTKVWNDVKNKNRNVAVRIPKEQIILKIREDCQEKLKKIKAKIFLIDNFKERSEKLDFKKLRDAMSEDLPELKKQALLDTYRDFTMFTPTLIINKGEILRKMILKAALLSGTRGLIPIIGASLCVDLGIVQKEVAFFANQLGINRDGPINEGVYMYLSESTLITVRKTELAWWKDISVKDVIDLMISERVKMSTASIPVIGSLVSGAISFFGTKTILDKLLGKMIKEALEINELISIDLAKDVKV